MSLYYLSINLFNSFLGEGGLKYMKMSGAQILQTDLNTFPLRVVRELEKISTCKHLPFHGHFYDFHNILPLCCIQFNIARRELMLVTHHHEGPHCLETFAHSFFNEFFFVVRIYEIN